MRLTQIRDFVSVMESGSIRAAARKLGLSQPAITKSLRSLETELQLQLVQRTSRGIVPTGPGRAFFARARLAHSELTKAEAEAARFATEGPASIAFGIGPAAAGLLLPGAIRHFEHRFPNVQIRIVEGLAHLLLPSVRDGTLDFAIGQRINPKPEPGISFRPLFQSNYVVVGRKGHPLGNKRRLQELASAKWLTLVPAGYPEGPIARMFSAAGLPPPKQTVHCESYNVIVSVLAKSDMLGVMSQRLLAEPLARGVLEQFEIDATMPIVSVGLFRLADAPLTRPAAAMAQALQLAAKEIRRAA